MMCIEEGSLQKLDSAAECCPSPDPKKQELNIVYVTSLVLSKLEYLVSTL